MGEADPICTVDDEPDEVRTCEHCMVGCGLVGVLRKWDA